MALLYPRKRYLRVDLLLLHCQLQAPLLQAGEQPDLTAAAGLPTPALARRHNLVAARHQVLQALHLSPNLVLQRTRKIAQVGQQLQGAHSSSSSSKLRTRQVGVRMLQRTNRKATHAPAAAQGPAGEDWSPCLCRNMSSWAYAVHRLKPWLHGGHGLRKGGRPGQPPGAKARARGVSRQRGGLQQQVGKQQGQARWAKHVPTNSRPHAMLPPPLLRALPWHHSWARRRSRSFLPCACRALQPTSCSRSRLT